MEKKDKKIFHIVVKNKQFVKIVESFFKDKNFNFSIKDSINIQNTKIEDQILILFDQINNNSLLLKKLFDKKTYFMILGIILVIIIIIILVVLIS